MNIFKKGLKAVNKLGSNIKNEAKRLGKKKVAGVSLGSALGNVIPGGNIIGSYAVGGKQGVMDDFKAGARNASLIVPIASKFGGGDLQPITPGQGGVPETIQNLPVGEGPSRYRSIMEFLGENKDDILDYAGALGSAYQGYHEGQQRDELFDRDRDEFRRLAPLRDAGMRGLMDTSRPDLSGVFAQDPQRYRKVSVGSMG